MRDLKEIYIELLKKKKYGATVHMAFARSASHKLMSFNISKIKCDPPVN